MTEFENIFLEKLLQENTGTLSRMKERDGSLNLAQALDDIFLNQLREETKIVLDKRD